MSTTTVQTAQYQSALQSTEQITYIPGAAPVNVPHSETNTTAQNLGPAQTKQGPPVVNDPVFQIALASGAHTLDLYTGLVDGGGNSITPTGLSVRAVKVQNPNASALAITPDSGSNPYPLTFTVPPYSEITVYDTGAGGVDPAGTLTGTSNGVFVKATNSTLTPGTSPVWTVNQLTGYEIIVDGHAYTVQSNSATEAIFTTEDSTDGTSVSSGTFSWNVVSRANPIITSTCCNLTLAGAGADVSTWTIWLG